MRRLNSIIFVFILFLLSEIPLKAQTDTMVCGTNGAFWETLSTGTFTGGRYKPHRSDIGGAPASTHYFPILIVFVSFKDEPAFTSTDTTTLEHWPYNKRPNYSNNLITKIRNPQTNWWDAYNGYEISDYWHELTRGSMHPLGQTVYIQLGQTKEWYYSYYGNRDSCEAKMKKDVYDSLKNNPNIDWTFYDKWTTTSDGNFIWDSDGLVDMLYLAFRNRSGGNISGGVAAGIAELGPCLNSTYGLYGDYTVYASGSDTVKINSGFGGGGSGCKIDAYSTGRYSRNCFLDIATHEHGHFLLGGGHNIYCKVLSGAQGEYSFNPWEMIKLDLIRKQTVTYGSQPNIMTLGDYSSHSGNAGTTGEIIEVPVSGDGNEFFLIANRRKVACFDRMIGGDTLADDGYQYVKNINPDYGKGVYIYHINGGYEWQFGNSQRFDLECADGLWDWEQDGTSYPIWGSPTPTHPVFKRKNPSYVQDNPAGGVTPNGRDGRSLLMTGVVNGMNKTMANWYSFGKSHNSSTYTSGTDGIWSNYNEPWFSLQVNGDRWDAWNTGYNEVFSPWSSPNTNNWNNNPTGIYIWYKAVNTSTNNASFEFYKVGVNGTEAQILEWTPPSKPMGINADPCGPMINNLYRIKLTWHHNMEPDMERTGDKDAVVKRYKIYRSTSAGLSFVPPDAMQSPENVYQYLATVDINANSAPEYIDQELISTCNTIPDGCCYQTFPVRYRVQAIDVYNTPSVLSDFAATTAYHQNGNGGGHEEEGDRPGNSSIPADFALKQNYPNPFNPSTNIQYDLPVDAFVSIKIYDILGKEMGVLVNENKKAGSYLISFDGSKFSSGIYFYKIQAANFEEIKRMILVK